MDDPVFGAGCVGEPQGESLSGGWLGFKFQPRLSFPSHPPDRSRYFRAMLFNFISVDDS